MLRFDRTAPRHDAPVSDIELGIAAVLLMLVVLLATLLVPGLG